jgi:hypothetical protein
LPNADLEDQALPMMRSARLVLGFLASAMCTIPIVILTGVVVDWAMGSPALFRTMVHTFESPGWARLEALFWSAFGFAGVVVGALPVLLVARSKKWSDARRLATAACAAALVGAAIGLITFGFMFAAETAAVALIMTSVLWLVAGR